MTTFGGVGAGQTKDGQIVRLRPPSGEDEFVGFAPQETCKGVARRVNERSRLASRVMSGGRVAEVLGKAGEHGLQHQRINWRSGVGV